MSDFSIVFEFVLVQISVAFSPGLIIALVINESVQKGRKNARKTVNSWNKTVNYDFGILDNRLDYYKTQFIYKKNVGNVYDSYADKYTALKENVDKTLSQKKVNDRLGYFYDYNTKYISTDIY